MSRESFENLKEVQSLLKQEKELLDKIAVANKRMTQLENQKTSHSDGLTEKQSNIKLIKEQYLECDKETSQKQDQLQQSKRALDHASNQAQADAAQKQIDTLEPLIDQLQTQAFELLEKEEELELQVKESQQFLAGISETINEVSKEVAIEVNKLREHLKINQQRITNLLSITEAQFSEAFQQSVKKHKYQNPLTTIENRSCRLCKYMPEAILLSAIERADEPFFCDGCQRLFSPL